MKKLRGALIGFGKIAELGHWPSYANSPHFEIVAIMDADPARQKAAQALRSGLRVYGRTETLFEREELDFVDICTPPSSHAAFTLEALTHACHVLCEKPLALSPKEYTAIGEAMQRHNRAVVTVHNWKLAPIFQKAFALLQERRIGPIWQVDIITQRTRACDGSVTEAHAEDWRNDITKAGGGILVDHGWHAFYLLLNIVQAEPKAIRAKMLSASANAVEDTVDVLVKFPAVNGYIHLTWCAKIRRNSIIVQGLQGTLLIDDDRILLSTLDGQREELFFHDPLSKGSHHADWFQALLPEFHREIQNRTHRGNNFKEAGWCLAMMDAAYESHRRGFKDILVELKTHIAPGLLAN